ncbi:DEAD/DEAH box helicase [Auraticoccus sp. F435]|uniref:DEAD/DEAH box helicase n=1 Tax=Auraticoccus cholistanensis TaxID=2656650 RepID=A0A6A9UT31_9ACTN|nr:DEAD/DEAH box helicase family protein [Auraticoccus cholistanensis]MVA76086.1 DEAD/DEAH box helicase [Auraticoccus cholistanensis]
MRAQHQSSAPAPTPVPAAPVPRRHQQEALDAVRASWGGGGRRAWVVLPPGAGKTLVGLWLAAERLADADDPVERVVVLSPNTAIQGQWLAEATRLAGLGVLPARCGADRDLSAELTALTYQSLAVFDPDSEVEEDGGEVSLLGRLHDNGAELVARLRTAGPLLLVLDECHHLLQVWGRLLQELLTELADVRVLGLTATPPAALTRCEAELVEAVFGEVVYEASIPALVKEGDLAPFAELAWLVTPTPSEQAWLAADGERFAELRSYLTDPTHGSISLLSWLDLRFCEPVRRTTSWAVLAEGAPELCRAALRMHHAGLMPLPGGARPTEADRVQPTLADWLLLVQDWLDGHLARSDDEADAAVVERLRRVLPGLGHHLTRNGIRRGRSPVDRVLARTEAKAHAAVQIVGHERDTLGARLRMLVLCDHERATATLPSALDGVLDAQAGSAWAVLQALLADPGTACLDPLLVTGRTVAGAPATLRALAAAVSAGGDDLDLAVSEQDGVGVLQGRWDSRRWVREVTDFFEAGRCQVLVGTRGLLGEGWDARGVSGLVDLTAATTITAVVQTRGRALRTDPRWPDKVALTWSVVALAPDHPAGHTDWDRLVRKHTGFWGVDADGDVVDGVAHLDPAFSPWHPPEASELGRVNARMVLRSQQRERLAALWRVGEPYRDELVHVVRVVPGGRQLGTSTEPVPVAVLPDGQLVARAGPSRARRHPGVWALLALAGLAAVLAVVLGPGGSSAAAALSSAAVVAVLSAAGLQGVLWLRRGRSLLEGAGRPPSVHQVACAVADALHEEGLSPAGAAAVAVVVDSDGSSRCHLAGVGTEASRVFAEVLDEAVGPVLSPRYLISRRSAGPVSGRGDHWRIGRGGPAPVEEVWHPVPALLGRSSARASSYARAWRHWVGEGRLVRTGTPEGSGLVRAWQGSDPLALTTLHRSSWE